MVHLAGFDQRGVDGPISSALIRTGEQMILAPERDGPDGALDDVVVGLDAPIVEEAGQARPARRRVADRLGEFPVAGDSGELGLNQGLHRLEDRIWRGLGGRPAAPKLEPPDIAFDGVEAADPRQRLDGDQGRSSRPGCRRSFAARAPAESQRNRVALGQRFSSEAVAIDLEASSEAGQMRGGTLDACGRARRHRRRPAAQDRPRAGRRGHRPGPGRSWSCVGPDRAPARASRRRRLVQTLQRRRTIRS